MPLVSIVIPAYNEERLIANSIRSALSQDYPVLEVIVVDDGSTDGTHKIIENFMKDDGRIRLIRHEKNRGITEAYNTGIKASQGEFVLTLHADCEFESSDWIRHALLHFNDGKVAAVTSRYVFPFHDLSSVEKIFVVLRKQIFDPDAKIEEITFLEGKCDLYRKSVLEMIGFFPASKIRVSGEDQVVSYSIRKNGYRIIRDNALTFIQRWGRSGSYIFGNLRNEYRIGKTQAGIFHMFRGFPLRETGKSKNIRSRVMYRASKLFFVFLVFLLMIAYSLFPSDAMGLGLIGVFFLRFAYFFVDNYRMHLLKLSELIWLSFLGIVTDFVYTFAFAIGSYLSIFHKRL